MEYRKNGFKGTVAGANAYVFNGEGTNKEGEWGRAMYIGVIFLALRAGMSQM